MSISYGIVSSSPSRTTKPHNLSLMPANASAMRTKPAAARGAEVPESAERLYTISALAQEFALTTRAIRFYEDEGLIAPVRKGRVRMYGERERVRIKLILRGK